MISESSRRGKPHEVLEEDEGTREAEAVSEGGGGVLAVGAEDVLTVPVTVRGPVTGPATGPATGPVTGPVTGPEAPIGLWSLSLKRERYPAFHAAPAAITRPTPAPTAAPIPTLENRLGATPGKGFGGSGPGLAMAI
jgi:hypothetical protein